MSGLELSRGRGADYGAHSRSEVVSLLDAPLGDVLDVGCAQGGAAELLRSHGASRLVGVELDPAFAETARSRYDEVLLGSVEDPLPWPEASFDTVLCYDVLEHLRDPWSTLARLGGLLRPGGRVHVALPNARQTAVWVPLVLHGTFAYAPEGLLDVTHLRFFTRRDAEELLASAGFELARVEHEQPDTWKGRLAYRLRPHTWAEFRAMHWYLEGRVPVR